MQRGELETRLQAVIAHYARVAKRLDKPRTKKRRKVSYREVLDDFLITRNFSQTGRAFELSNNAVHYVIYRAIRIAEKLRPMSKGAVHVRTSALGGGSPDADHRQSRDA